MLQEALVRTGVVLDDDKLKGHPLRRFHPRGLFSAPRTLLVGDAAGVDPLLGEGISFALGYLGPLVGWLAEHYWVDWGE